MCCFRRGVSARVKTIELDSRTCWKRDFVPSWSNTDLPNDFEKYA